MRVQWKICGRVAGVKLKLFGAQQVLRGQFVHFVVLEHHDAEGNFGGA